MDLAVSQNANAMTWWSRLLHSSFVPPRCLTELAGGRNVELIEGQKLLLSLARKEYENVATGLKERVAGYGTAVALTDLAQRGFDTFVEMQLDS